MKVRSEFLAHLIGHNLRRSYFISSQIFSEEFAELRITPVQIAKLEAISLRSDLSQKDIAAIAGSSPQVVVPLIKKLEDRGFVERIRSKTDRRFHHLILTEAGQVIHSKITSKLPEFDEHLLHAFSPEEKETLLKLLLKIIDSQVEE